MSSPLPPTYPALASADAGAFCPPYNLLSLFAGIGGFELGLERSGLCKTVAQCEIDPYCQKVLAKHWPEVKRYDDVRELTAERLAADGIRVDVICGGFPCQDISTAGKGAGIDGERSGLWREYARLVGELRPRYIFVENVAALLGRGLERVLGDLAALGYNAEWHCIPAFAVGAPHRRDRLWIVAHSPRERCGKAGKFSKRPTQRPSSASAKSGVVADTHGTRLEGRAQGRNIGTIGARVQQFIKRRADSDGPAWNAEPDVGRVANGVPRRVDRLRALGNAVVPQVPELLGRAVLEWEATHD